jgi:hypothetical protein
MNVDREALNASLGRFEAACLEGFDDQSANPIDRPQLAYRARGAQIPIAPAALPTFPQRGFLPWRLLDAGHRQSSGRHPKPFT